MHDLDRIQAELADDTVDDDQYFEFDEDDDYELDDEDDDDDLLDEYDDDDELDDDDDLEFDDEETVIAEDDDSPLDEDEEIDLASDLLAATDDVQLETAVKRIVRPRSARRPRRPGYRRRHRAAAGGIEQEKSRKKRRRRRKRRRGFLGKALKGIAKKALPALGGAVGTLVAPGVGTAAGAALAGKVGKAFGLELEGLSPEDQEFAVARRLARLGADAAEESDLIDPDVDDETAAKVAVIRAAGKHAPGIMPRTEGATRGASPPGRGGPGARRGAAGRTPGRSAGRPAAGRGAAKSGRWERRGNNVILIGL